MFAAASRGNLLSAAALLLSCSSLLAADPAVADKLAPTDRLLPPNTLVYFSVTDCVRSHEKFAETGFGQMVNDPAMADVREELMKKFNEASDKFEANIGVPLSDLLAIPSGEAAFAVLQPPGQKLGLMLMLDIGDHQELLDKLLDKAKAEIEDGGQLAHSTDEFEGTEITVFKDESPAPNQPLNGFAWCVKDSMFVLGTSVELIEGTLVRWDGEHDKTFADDETYRYIVNRCDLPGDGEPAMKWFINPLGLLKAGMAAAGPEVGMQGAMVMGFLPVLGLDRLKGMGGLTDMATDDYDAISHGVIYVDQPPTGVLRAMVCPPAEQTPPSFIPADVPTISGLNWDVPGAYAAIESVYDFFTQPGTFGKMMDDAAEAPNGPKLHPRDDFLAHLSGQIYIVQELTVNDNAPAPQQKMAFLLGLKDEAAMQATVEKLMAMDGVDVSVRDFNGAKIYEAENPPQNQPISPAAAISNGYLMMVMNVEMLESFLRGGDDSLAKSDEFQLVRKEFPDQVSTFSYQRQDQVMESVYEMAKLALSQQGDFDTSILPEFEPLRKYFGVAGSYAVPDEKGVFISSFSFQTND
jgi:hypothetical protein